MKSYFSNYQFLNKWTAGVLTATFVLISIVPVLAFPQIASAATSGPNNADSFSNSGTGEDWGDTSRAETSNNSYSVVELNDHETSEYLKAVDFDFSIPNTATIDGIKVEVEKKAESSQKIKDNAVRIVKGGNIGTQDKSNANDWGTTDAYASYGSASDLWGTTWTPADINASNFGFAFSAKKYNSSGGEYEAKVDHIRITVYYTEAPVEPETFTLSAQKVVCDAEQYLPNWGAGDTNITSTTAQNWVDQSAGKCRLADWTFEWSLDGVANPGDNTGAGGANWNSFSGSIEIPLENKNKIWVREVWNDAYIPFSGQNTNQPVSAELYCHTDGLNYDNWDWIDGLTSDATYHCVGFNVLVEVPPTTGSIEITKYSCPADFVPNRTNNGVGSVVPEGCVPQNGVEFGYVYNPAQSDANGPYPELNESLTSGGITGNDGVLTISGLASAGRYLVKETDPTNLQGLYCQGDGDQNPNNNDNQELTFVPANGVTKCVAYNETTSTSQTSDVTMCKVDQNGAPLSGWTLMLKGDHVEDIEVPTDTSAGINTASLVNGTSYIAEAVGTWLNQGGANPVDAEYSTTDAWATQMDGYTGYSTDILELQINSVFDPNSNWGTYNSAHNYAQSFLGAGASANFRIFDGTGGVQNEGWFGDNIGSLDVSIHEGYAGVTGENGCVVFEDVPFGSYSADEIMQDGWENDAGLVEVVVNEATETFTIVNSPIGEEAQYCRVDVVSAVGDEGVGNGNAVAAWVHGNWTALLNPFATWIWTTNLVENPGIDEAKTFTKTFNVTGPVNDATLEFSADNRYWISVNGTEVASSTDEVNYNAVTTVDVTSYVTTGSNTIEMRVENIGIADSTAEGNPAAGIYRLVVNGEEELCGPGNPDPDPTPVSLFVKKYVDGVPASEIDASFPLEITNTNHNGTFPLDAENAYSKTFSLMTPNNPVVLGETISGDYMVSSAEVCEAGKYYPIGLSYGSSFENAASSTKTASLNFQITADTYVIVWNNECPDVVPETPNDPPKVNQPEPGPDGDGDGDGEVLGATTGEVLGESCGLYMDKFIRTGRANDADQVKKLQIFLNKWMNSGLPITGFYGPLTLAALNAFQNKYAGDVLTPWNLTGPTGIVYFTTLRWINKLECPDLVIDVPTLIDWSKNSNLNETLIIR